MKHKNKKGFQKFACQNVRIFVETANV